MERVFEIAAGIDVHRDTVVVSVRRQLGRQVQDVETRTFETFHDGLVAMTVCLAAIAYFLLRQNRSTRGDGSGGPRNGALTNAISIGVFTSCPSGGISSLTALLPLYLSLPKSIPEDG